MQIDKLIEELTELKKSLEKAGPAHPHKGKPLFNMEHVTNVSNMKDHNEAKAYAHSIVDKGEGNPKNKAKMKNMINGSKHIKHLANGMSSFILAHPSEGLKVIKSDEDKTEDKKELFKTHANGQWSIE